MTTTSPPSPRTAERAEKSDRRNNQIAIICSSLAIVAIAALTMMRVPWVLSVVGVLIGTTWIVPGRSTRARVIITGVVIAAALVMHFGYLWWSGQIGGYSVHSVELE